jgi:hypothetical protein
MHILIVAYKPRAAIDLRSILSYLWYNCSPKPTTGVVLQVLVQYYCSTVLERHNGCLSTVPIPLHKAEQKVYLVYFNKRSLKRKGGKFHYSSPANWICEIFSLKSLSEDSVHEFFASFHQASVRSFVSLATSANHISQTQYTICSKVPPFCLKLLRRYKKDRGRWENSAHLKVKVKLSLCFFN